MVFRLDSGHQWVAERQLALASGEKGIELVAKGVPIERRVPSDGYKLAG